MSVNAQFVITLSAASDKLVSLNYATRDGTAVAGTDYTQTSGTLSFQPGERSKSVSVPVLDRAAGSEPIAFYLDLSDPANATVLKGTGLCEITVAAKTTYLERFDALYDIIKAPANGYFGPPTGAKARQFPYHTIETLINEAPDWGHESVSETVSFWANLEAWRGALKNDWAGYQAVWNSIDANYVPSTANQPVGAYTPGNPATYQPEGDAPSVYPTGADPSKVSGPDPLYAELLATYGTKGMYLMHWVVDVDGVYGYANGDGTKQGVFINNYQRGMHESAFETVTHPSWEDFKFGGPSGFLPLFSKNKPDYPSEPNSYSKQWRYTCAPDAEVRVIQSAFLAHKFAAENGANVAVQDTRAKKMGDHLRYSLFDKYFHKVGQSSQPASSSAPYESCHYLIGWYASWGGAVPEAGAESAWGFRIGSSECHQGYQAPDAAYYMATGGGGYTPQAPSAGDTWLGSMYRQIEMLRWLQSPEGPIAGGVSNSWKGRYETPTDGRQLARFYGMDYTYAPVWHDPPSNNWFGFQCWGLQRVAGLLLEVSDKTSALAVEIRPNLEIILDRFVVFALNNLTFNPTTGFELPADLGWTSPTQIVGQTATAPNLEGVYEFLPNRAWDGTGSYAEFWDASTVPNPNLHCAITARGVDLGVAATLCRLLVEYAEAKRRMGKFTTAIPAQGSTTHTPESAFNAARDLLDVVWDMYGTALGITREEERADYKRMGETVYVPASFSGTMASGDKVEPGATYASIRSFVRSHPDYAKVQAYIADPVPAKVPKFTYHRFWANAEYASACAAMHKYFSDLV